MLFFYNIGIHLFILAVRIAAIWNEKAAKMIRGRKKWKKKYPRNIPAKHHKRYWFHCASLGEFEMARPVIEKLQVEMPETEIIISFFSPSGFELRNNFLCTGVFYLPFDTRKNAAKWLDITDPDVVVFVKYDFWLNYMTEAVKRQIECVAISVLFREGQFFFEPWAAAWKTQLQKFRRIFVQNQVSADTGKNEELNNIIIAGDTRFDRVLDTVTHAEPLPEIERFKGENPLLICGSSWPAEENFLFEYLTIKSWPLGWRWVIAPHDISGSHISEIMNLFSDYYPIRYSEWINVSGENLKNKILIIDNIGMLSRIYRYGDAAVIGGAWGKGLHNILEAAAFGMPVLFGPKYQKFPEAAEGIEQGFCFSANKYDEFEIHLNRMLGNVEWRKEVSEKSREYVAMKSGATNAVIEYFNKVTPHSIKPENV